MTNNKVGDVELKDEVFGVEMNAGLLHQAVVMQMASWRLGTHSTKTRGMVKGGGRKPWRQKGTGRARAGSRRSPVWVGGGTVFGPHPRDYSFRMPRKQRRLAIKCALSDKVKSGEFVVLDSLSFDAPKTKQMVKLLQDFGVTGKALFITLAVDDSDKAKKDKAQNVDLSARNIPGVKAINTMGLNVYDILHHNRLFITKDAITRIEEVFA
jgi:large subunit ribosomal protein L4